MQVLTTFFGAPKIHADVTTFCAPKRKKSSQIKAHPLTMPSKRKAAALEAMRQRRQGSYRSSIDDYEVKDEGEVYEVMDEGEYQKLVESRRQREDFVVDDGECNRGSVVS